ncbi:hypothetical protein LTR93_010853 [Exophiala xenobiotica]|nr:hypothetical protein LTR93_010853 [Exophiala xenobiotica]
MLKPSPAVPKLIPPKHYCCSIILLPRSAARFGTGITQTTSPALGARNNCVGQAIRVAKMLDAYRRHNGHASTMVGIAFYNITIVAVVLVAAQADNLSSSDMGYVAYIGLCLEALEELENSYIVARTVLKQIKCFMKRCKLQYSITKAEIGAMKTIRY